MADDQSRRGRADFIYRDGGGKRYMMCDRAHGGDGRPMTSEESEKEARAGATAAVPDAAGGAAAAAAEVTAEAASVETVAGAATPETLAAAATPPATIQPTADTAAEAARDTPPPSPPPEEGARIGNSLETIKTAVVWLVVIQILTILSPLLRASLKWTLIVGVVLTLSSFAVGVLAYLKAQRAQRSLPE
ncbi:MAG: hypothetical protein LC803_13055 [Acidobacteria bacterium]|nr:hypothetical protein [Acidobacteriota bacterium]